MGTQHIASDLVANVHSIAVSVGQRVEAGDELVLLESMKMEIPVVPEEPGTVVEIRVQPGDVVQEGDVLVVLQRASAARRGREMYRFDTPVLYHEGR